MEFPIGKQLDLALVNLPVTGVQDLAGTEIAACFQQVPDDFQPSVGVAVLRASASIAQGAVFDVLVGALRQDLLDVAMPDLTMLRQRDDGVDIVRIFCGASQSPA